MATILEKIKTLPDAPGVFEFVFYPITCYFEHMNTLVIPKELMRKGDLVLVPREEYESLLRTRAKKHRPKIAEKNIGGNMLEIAKALPAARRLKRHKAFYEGLDKSLAESLQQYKEGKHHGSFETGEGFTKFLHSRRIATKK